MVGGVESDYSVCPRPFLQFCQFCQFMSVRLRQVTSYYVSLCWRDGTWSSTKIDDVKITLSKDEASINRTFRQALVLKQIILFYNIIFTK